MTVGHKRDNHKYEKVDHNEVMIQAWFEQLIWWSIKEVFTSLSLRENGLTHFMPFLSKCAHPQRQCVDTNSSHIRTKAGSPRPHPNTTKTCSGERPKQQDRPASRLFSFDARSSSKAPDAHNEDTLGSTWSSRTLSKSRRERCWTPGVGNAWGMRRE